jgi:predicted RecB family nuclease
MTIAVGEFGRVGGVVSLTVRDHVQLPVAELALEHLAVYLGVQV